MVMDYKYIYSLFGATQPVAGYQFNTLHYNSLAGQTIYLAAPLETNTHCSGTHVFEEYRAVGPGTACNSEMSISIMCSSVGIFLLDWHFFF